MNAPQTPGGPSKRRRIAGEVKPGDASPAPATPSGPKAKLPKPKLPKRPNPPRAGRAGGTPTQPAPPTTSDLPAAPPRSEAIRVSRAKPSVGFVLLLVLAVASLGFGAYGVWRGVDERRSNSIVEARAGATDAAASAIETIYTYEYNNLDEHTRKSRATMTPKLAKSVAPTTRALKQLAPLRKTRVKAVVRYAAAKECGDRCSPHKATVLVFFDLARANADSEKPTVETPRLDVFMVERNGKWLVDNIDAL